MPVTIRERSGRRVSVLAPIPLFVLVTVALASPRVVGADPPAGYYATVDATNAQTLRATVHDVIDDHTRIPYTSSALDTWDVLDLAQENPANSSRILDVYRNASFPKAGGGNPNYNREHTWPSSLGFPNDGSTNYPYTDLHHLHLSDDGYNSSRGNKPYDSCNAGCTELTTDANGGQGGTAGVYPGQSNWTASGGWETWSGRSGDVARAVLYMDVRYEGGTHGVTGASEPDLILTDNASLITSNTSENRSVAYMGMLSVLLQWHAQDPVDDFERRRNDVVFGAQGNRNPFVDHPEWVECVFSGVCDGSGGGGGGGGGGGSGVAGVFINEFHYDDSGTDKGEFVEIAGPAGLDLSGWQLVGYNGSGAAPYKTISLAGVIDDQGGCMGTIDFAFTGLQNGSPDGIALIDSGGNAVDFVSYEGSFTAASGPAAGVTSTDVGVVEGSGTSAGHSLQRTGTGIEAKDFSWTGPSRDTPGSVNTGQTFGDACGGGGGDPGGGGGGDPWINEFHYDNASTDTGEFVEVAGPAGMSLAGWELLGYNGADGGVYKVVALSGSLPSQQGGAGAASFAFTGLQNGSPDGIALVDPTGRVVEFVSYEGSLTASSGPASGEGATNVGVTETSSTPVGHSLQRTGTGCSAADFSWSSPSADTPGNPNSGQSFSCP